MTYEIKRYERNPNGRDLIVGDIHGCFDELSKALFAVGFNSKEDRLFSVGDMVDRGPESEASLIWLDKPWFKAVRGNHEMMTIDYHHGRIPTGMLAMNGGAWLIAKTQAERQPFVDAFDALPLAIELETENGLIAIVHADCPSPDWIMFRARIDMGGMVAETAAEAAVWSRGRIDNMSFDGVKGVLAVVVGHTPMDSMTSLDNVIYIDTMGWRGKAFTILDAATLRPAVKP